LASSELPTQPGFSPVPTEQRYLQSTADANWPACVCIWYLSALWSQDSLRLITPTGIRGETNITGPVNTEVTSGSLQECRLLGRGAMWVL
jgi:hypothetical protein